MASIFTQATSPTRSTFGFREQQRHESPGFVKKRKQSLDGSECETLPSERKDSLHESFSALTLSGKKNTLCSEPSSNSTEGENNVGMPKTLKFGNIMAEIPLYQTRENLPNHQYKKEEFLQNLINLSQTDVAGISKYLDLDLSSKIQTIEKTTRSPEKKASLTAITNFFNSPFCSAFSTLLLPSADEPKKEISKSYAFLGNSAKKNFNTEEEYIGPLTREERMKKINNYLEKKRNRCWQQVRYNVRKDLADKRERVQGRFVKTKKSSVDMNEMKNEDVSTNNNSFASLVKMEDLMSSEFARNNRNESCSTLKRSLLSDN